MVDPPGGENPVQVTYYGPDLGWYWGGTEYRFSPLAVCYGCGREAPAEPEGPSDD